MAKIGKESESELQIIIKCLSFSAIIDVRNLQICDIKKMLTTECQVVSIYKLTIKKYTTYLARLAHCEGLMSKAFWKAWLKWATSLKPVR